MLAVFDNKKNVGGILMISGIVLFVAAIYGFATDSEVTLIEMDVEDLVIGEIMFLVGFGIFRRKPYAHFFRLFDDCESRVGILCSISAGFGLSYIIAGVFSVVLKDSFNAVDDIVSGLALLIAPGIVINFKGQKVAMISHVIMCVSTTIVFIISCVMTVWYIVDGKYFAMLEYLFSALVLLIAIVYIFDRSVMKEIWGKNSTMLSKTQSV